MTCYHPIPARLDFHWPIGAPAPKARARLNPADGATLMLGCGHCLGCRTSHALQWAHRAAHEASVYLSNSFVTLTYTDEALPKDGGLEPAALIKFIKRLRMAARRHHPALATDHTRRLRYLASGEYGELNDRPHYHLCLFNIGFTDAFQVGSNLYESPILGQLWPYGTHKLGTLTPASANYVAQYALKKIGQGNHDRDGVVRQAHFLRMSRKPPLGTEWLQKYKTDLTHGYLVTSEGRKTTIPRSYKKRLRKEDPQLAATIDKNTESAPRRLDNLAALERIHTHEKARHEARHL